MFGIVILEVVLGLIFIYLLLSLLATTINELVMRVIYSRGKNLHKALRTMLDDEQDVLCKKFFAHPLIQKLKKNKSDFPSYISHEYFSTVLIELLYKEENSTLQHVREAIHQLPDSKTKEVLFTFVREAKGDLDKFKENIEKWYQEVMNQATGWYKTRVQQVLFVLGLVISMIFNADTLRIAHHLSVDPETRRQIIEQAQAYIAQHDSIAKNAGSFSMSPQDTTVEVLKSRIYELINEEVNIATSTLGMGWQTAPPFHIREASWWAYLGKSLVGWILTAFAITLGAPFWFDLLKKIMNIRAAGARPEDVKKFKQIANTES